MEDISRELEKEIAQTKPKPYKQDLKSRVVIIDDFGRMKSGEYLRRMTRLLSVACGVLLVAAGVFFFLYTGLAGNSEEVDQRLEKAEAKVAMLTKEKELLMARLVMMGEETGLEKKKPVEDKAAPEQKKPLVAKKPVKLETPPPKNEQPVDASPVEEAPLPAETAEVTPAVPAGTDEANPKKKRVQNVGIEKFTVTKDGHNGDLLVRFDIRNISDGPGDVSGRIFTILKPENGGENQWLVVPSTNLENGIPSEYRKGQYFSIAHFKPVKFRTKSHAGPDFFQKAAIYVFNTDGELMVEKLIPITEAE